MAIEHYLIIDTPATPEEVKAAIVHAVPFGHLEEPRNCGVWLSV